METINHWRSIKLQLLNAEEAHQIHQWKNFQRVKALVLKKRNEGEIQEIVIH